MCFLIPINVVMLNFHSTLPHKLFLRLTYFGSLVVGFVKKLSLINLHILSYPQAPKYTGDELAELTSTCFKLNSLQLRALLHKYQPTPDEPRLPHDVIENVVRVSFFLCIPSCLGKIHSFAEPLFIACS